MFVVVEGIDGSGKDTQFGLLKGKKDFAYFKYPTSQNKRIHDYLERKMTIDGSELVNLFLDDIYGEQERIAAAMKKGLALADRYIYSTIAYEAHLVPFDEIQRRVERYGLIKPDLVILLDLPARVAHERKKKQKELDRYEEDVTYLESVRQNFLELHNLGYFAKKWVKIDASQPIEAVHKAILNVLDK